jgi:hypothetical protein
MAQHTRFRNFLDFAGNPFRTIPRHSSESASNSTRARRQFVNDMLMRNPDAFASELDVQNMLFLYHGRF